MPQPAKGGSRYMAALDGLRALAVFAVIAYHVDPGGVPGGLLGVGVFFTLSGYLITDLLTAEWDRAGRLDLGDFWARRARRLLPALFVMLVVVVDLLAIARPAELGNVRGDAIAAALYVSNWWYIFHHVSYFARWGPPSPFGHLWSLAVEEQFYLLWPLLLWLGLRRLRNRSVLALVVLALAAASAAAMAALYRPGADPNRVYYGTDTRAFGLLVGAALALVWPSRGVLSRVTRDGLRRLSVVGLAGLALVLLLIVGTTQDSPFLYRGGMVLLALATAATVAALAHPATAPARLLAWRPLVWLGERSYAVYLWHYPVITLTTPVGAPPDVLRGTAQVAASLLLADLSWRLVEDPIRRGRLAELLQARRLRWPTAGHPRALARRVAVGGLVAASACLAVTGLSGLASGPAPPAVTVTSITPPPARPSGAVTALHREPYGALLPSGVRAVGTSAPVSTPPPAGVGVTAIGDSVLIDAAPYLRQLLPGIVIDAEVGRQMLEAPTVLARLAREGDLGDRVLVIELGTNGPFSRQLLVQILRSVHVGAVVFVNTRVPRPWQSQVNATLAWAARAYRHVAVADWYDASQNQGAWFYSDGVHLNAAGARAYAELVARAVRAAEADSPRKAPTIHHGAAIAAPAPGWRLPAAMMHGVR